MGLQSLRFTVNVGIACEAVASVGIGLALIFLFAEQPVSAVTETAGTAGGGPLGPSFLAAIAIAGWVLLGYAALAAHLAELVGALQAEAGDCAEHVRST